MDLIKPIQPNMQDMSINNDTGIEDIFLQKLCPLCQSQVRLFFINFNEKMLMCENVDCEYPFGYDDLKFVKIDNDGLSNDQVASIKGQSSAICSMASTAAWSEVGRLYQVCEAEDSQFDTPAIDVREYITNKDISNSKSVKTDSKKEIMVQNIKEITELNQELKDDSPVRRSFKDEKWIKRLMSVQGVKFLKPEELEKIKSNDKLRSGELKINIGTGENNVSTIEIELTNHNPTESLPV